MTKRWLFRSWLCNSLPRNGRTKRRLVSEWFFRGTEEDVGRELEKRREKCFSPFITYTFEEAPMEIKEVTVHVGMEFEHPYEVGEGITTSVRLKADVVDGDDIDRVIKDLQAKAQLFVEDHKTFVNKNLKRDWELKENWKNIETIKKEINRCQEQWNNLLADQMSMLVETGEGASGDESEGAKP